jgi:hypothetical protein
MNGREAMHVAASVLISVDGGGVMAVLTVKNVKNDTELN